MDQNEIKTNLGRAAAEIVENGMIVGLGSGSTAECFIKSLIKRSQKGLNIRAVSSSKNSLELAANGGISVSDINDVPHIDLTIDGADEIDPQKRMIKGGGGAHVREKILASSSSEMIVIVDETKLVDHLGKRNLPVEILFYGSPATKKKLESLGYTGKWRVQKDGSLFITDNGNILLDIIFESPIKNPEEIHEKIIRVPGVIDTGFFFNLAGRVLVGYENGQIETKD